MARGFCQKCGAEHQFTTLINFRCRTCHTPTVYPRASDPQRRCDSCRRGAQPDAEYCPWCGEPTAARPKPAPKPKQPSAAKQAAPVPKTTNESAGKAAAKPPLDENVRETLEMMREVGAFEDTKYSQDADYARNVDAVAKRIAAEDGNKKTALQLFFQGLEAGDVEKGLAAHRLIHRFRTAGWKEYSVLHAEVTVLLSQLKPDTKLAVNLTRFERGLRDRTGKLITLYLLFGLPVSVLVGVVAAGLGLVVAAGMVAETAPYWGEVKDGLSGLVSWMILFPLAWANRLAMTYRAPRIDPSKIWILVVNSLLMFGGLMFGDYLLHTFLAHDPISLSRYFSGVLDGAASSWLFAFPLVVIAANHHRAIQNPLPAAKPDQHTQQTQQTIDDAEQVMGDLGLPSFGWLVIAAIAVPISAIIRGILILLGR